LGGEELNLKNKKIFDKKRREYFLILVFTLEEKNSIFVS